MNAKQVIKVGLDFNLMALKTMLGDFTDAELLVRPVPNANHVAWQLGHLINSEVMLLSKVPGVRPAELPAGFTQQHDKSTAGSDQGFLTKAEYLALIDRVRASTLAALEQVSEADLDKATGMDLAPTVGAVFSLIVGHMMMHGGQVTVVRRKLGKPVLF